MTSAIEQIKRWLTLRVCLPLAAVEYRLLSKGETLEIERLIG